MQTVFTIALPTHLVKFCEKTFFDDIPEKESKPYRVTERDLLGKHILLLLIDKRCTPYTNLQDFRDKITIELSHTLAKRGPSLLKLNRLYIFIDEMFRHTMLTFVKAQIMAGENRYQALRRFFAMYGIDDESLFTTSYTFISRKTNVYYKAKVKERYEKGLS